MLLSWGENKNKLEAEAVSSSDSDGKGLLCCLPVTPELRKRDTEASEQPGKCLRQPFPVSFQGCQTPSRQRTVYRWKTEAQITDSDTKLLCDSLRQLWGPVRAPSHHLHYSQSCKEAPG